MLTPPKKIRVYEEIIKQVIDMIHQGTLQPGDKLPTERQLSIDLKVSRSAIREALRSMESMGYIQSKVGGGTYIKSLTLDSVLYPFASLLTQDKILLSDLLVVRQLLESEIAALAAQKINSEKINKIKQVLDDMEEEIVKGGNGVIGDNNFHDVLAQASENSAIKKIMDMCGSLLSDTRKATLDIPGQPFLSLEDHQNIYNAIKLGDDEQARQLMKTHLKRSKDVFERYYLSTQPPTLNKVHEDTNHKRNVEE